ncbi:MAG: fibronectin type III domain-containing protein [Bacillota bacterium]
MNKSGKTAAIPNDLTVTTKNISVPQGNANNNGGVLVAMVDPLVYQVEETDTAFINEAIDTIATGQDLVLQLAFSGPGTINNVTEENIKFYQKDAPDNLYEINLSPQGKLTKSTGFTVSVKVYAGSIEEDTEYVLFVGKDICGNNAAKNIGKDIYYYLATGAASVIPDEEAPYWEANDALTITNQKGTSLQLNWPAAKDNTRVENYLVYQGQELLTTTNKRNYTVTNLVPGESYTFQVKAIDGAGNISATGLSLTGRINFEALFLVPLADDDRAYGLDIQPVISAAFLTSLDKEVINNLPQCAVLEKVSDHTSVPVDISLANNDTVLQVVPQSPLEYGTLYCLTLDEGIKNTHGSTLEGQRSLEFSTVSFAPPQVEVLKDGTAVNSLVAGTSYNLKVIVNNTALVEEETKVLMVVRTGKGARLEFGGDAMSNEQSFSIPAEGSHEFTYSFMLPQDTVGAAYIDVYTISNNGKFFKTLPVHEKYPVNQ